MIEPTREERIAGLAAMDQIIAGIESGDRDLHKEGVFIVSQLVVLGGPSIKSDVLADILRVIKRNTEQLVNVSGE